MKTVLYVVTLVSLVALFAPAAIAAISAPSTPVPAAIAVDVNQVTVKVVGMDVAKRTITLELPNGKSKTYRVSKEAGSIAHLKKGDMITTTLMDSIAVYLQKKGARPTATETETIAVSPKGAKTKALIIANTVRISGKIKSVDAAARTLTIMGPDGKTKTFKVGPNVKNLANLKAGEDIIVRYTEAAALDITKPKR